MPETTVTRTVRVANVAGVHARAAAMIATLLRPLKSRVTLAKGSNRVEGTDVIQIMSLVAAPGEELLLEATGEDAAAAMDSLEALFLGKFGED